MQQDVNMSMPETEDDARHMGVKWPVEKKQEKKDDKKTVCVYDGEGE